ncbi:MAG: hypothetical protein KY396_04510, partial [Actinobacteria bacterium]|nr:hypothetical protein [Actinomycetota bacterium]
KTADAFPVEPDRWRPQEPPPDEIAGLLGRWWSEAEESIFSWRRGRLEARRALDARETEPCVFESVGYELFRTVSGRERGELLRVVRDDDGVPIKLFWASYPFLRTPEVFGARAETR